MTPGEALAAWGPWLAAGLATLSVVTLVIGALWLPGFVRRLPADTLTRPGPTAWTAGRVARNLVGLGVLAAGIAMLVLPGQGLLTILVAVLLIDLPGKRRLAAALLRRRGVRRVVDRWRAEAGEPPLEVP